MLHTFILDPCRVIMSALRRICCPRGGAEGSPMLASASSSVIQKQAQPLLFSFNVIFVEVVLLLLYVYVVVFVVFILCYIQYSIYYLLSLLIDLTIAICQLSLSLSALESNKLLIWPCLHHPPGHLDIETDSSDRTRLLPRSPGPHVTD
jgi:hypothetical protein